MVIVRAITLLSLRLNIAFKVLHVNGCFNQIADSLSRFNLQKFQELAPEAEQEPTPVPSCLWTIFN